MDKVVLVVDDSMTVRKFVAASLNMKGFRVRHCCGWCRSIGTDAFGKIRSYHHGSQYARHG